MYFGSGDWATMERAAEKEWLLANGVGGFASSTIIGANARRYHGLLIASVRPPVERRLMVCKIEETLIAGGQEADLSSDFYADRPPREGHTHLRTFIYDGVSAQWIYEAFGVFIEKTIFVVHGENTTAVIYRVLGEAPSAVHPDLVLTPLVNFRDYHHTARQEQGRFRQDLRSSWDVDGVPLAGKLTAEISACLPSMVQATASAPLRIQTPVSPMELFISSCPEAPVLRLIVAAEQTRGSAEYRRQDTWRTGMFYPIERFRGLDDVEDHHVPGSFVVPLTSSSWVYVVMTIEDRWTGLTTQQLARAVEGALGFAAARRSSLIRTAEAAIDALVERAAAGDAAPDGSGGGSMASSSGIARGFEVFDEDELALVGGLIAAADAFIVRRGDSGERSIIAGYPWFTDWGRDTMISLTGLCLVTGRFDDARRILSTFASHTRRGLVPNRFSDEGTAEYNTADASLWFIHAVERYLAYTHDLDTVGRHLFPVVMDIIAHYACGTDFSIRMDDDGLITQGSEGVQLTWMDAKVGDYVVTPRHGKAVEINALWYGALEFAARLSEKLRVSTQVPGLGVGYRDLAEKVRTSFNARYWREDASCLYDVVDPQDPAFRPNQLLAVSLTWPVVTGERAVRIVDAVTEKLYIGTGVRSLAPGEPGYHAAYKGNQYQRDSAYHQGTAWSWLCGPLVSGLMRAKGRSSETVELARAMLRPFIPHLRDHGIGYISEIFEGGPPHRPRGCIAQAWGVAEVLRAYVEDVAGLRPEAF